jgi:hypothetical protein
MKRQQENRVRRDQQRTKKLRKQPPLRRMQSATSVAMPRVRVPETAAYRRKRNSRRRRWHLPTLAIRKVIFTSRWISLGLLALCIYAMVLSGLSLDFYLTTIPVQGARSLPVAEVVAASGLAGSHVFAADPNEAATKIAEMPGVISATVTLSWPNQVLVQIKEDSPVAIWRDGGQDFWITEEGSLIPARAHSDDLPIIISEVPFTAESAPEDDESNIEAIPIASVAFVPLDVLQGALQLKQLRPSMGELFYRPLGGLSYQDAGGWRAYFGTGTDMQQKLVVYEAILADLQSRELTPEYISVSNQEKPYFMAR